MMGTLAAELAGKGIRTHKEIYRADASGDIENVGGILKITKIVVDYYLKAPEEKQPQAREAFDAYLPKCPAAQSVTGCIELDHNLNMEAL